MAFLAPVTESSGATSSRSARSARASAVSRSQLSPPGRGRRSEGGEGQERDLHQPARAARRTWTRSTSSRTLPAEYRGTVQPDQDERRRRRDLRAPAEAGPVRRQVRDPPRRDPHARRSRAGHRVRQHRQPADSVAGISRLRRGRHEGTGRTEGPAAVRRDSEQQPAGRLPGRAIRAAQHDQLRRGRASRSASAASRSATA